MLNRGKDEYNSLAVKGMGAVAKKKTSEKK